MKNRMPILSLFIFMFSMNAYAYSEKIEVIDLNFPNIINHAKTLPRTGILKAQNTFVYLSVSDRYRLELFNRLLKHLSAPEKKCLMSDNASDGEHITVFESGNINAQELKSLPLGKSFSFDVMALQKVTIIRNEKKRLQSTIPSTTVWYVINVKSTALAKLRSQQMNKKYPFHMSFAVAKFNRDGSCFTSPELH